MKSQAKASLWLLLTGIMMFFAVGCGGQKQHQSESQLDDQHSHYVPNDSRHNTIAFIGQSQDYLIRIDNIGDGYRYAAWKHKSNMDDEPDLVIDNGLFDSEEGAYVFENNGYSYLVEVVQTSSITPNLLVYQGNKQLLKQPLTILEENIEHSTIEFHSLGEVVGSDGATIRLVECIKSNYGASISYDYFLKALSGEDNPVEKKVFEAATPIGEKCYRAYSDTITSYFHWLTTTPDGDYYAFNKGDNTLYCACGQDRFNVYQFDGNHFIFVRQDGGFWLHPSIRSFSRLVNVYETKGFVIRIDKINEGGNTCRYAAWKKGAESYPAILSKMPDLVINNGRMDNVMVGYSEYSVSSFENEGYQYIVDESKLELTVYKGKDLVLRQKIEKTLYY